MGFIDVWKAIRQQGGIFRSVKALFMRDSLKPGTLVGTDDYGNRYYENNDYYFLRNRWVEYADHVGLNYDASQIPAEWFGWMHHRTDLTPDKEPFRPKYHWMAPHEENMTGTLGEYVPYTTTKPKIQAWVPPRAQRSGSESDTTNACGNRRIERQPPTGCKEEDKNDEEGESPAKCEIEDAKEECKDRVEKETKPTCEKPDTAFH